MQQILFRMDAEQAHRWTLNQLEEWPNLSASLMKVTSFLPPSHAAVTIAGLPFSSPIGLAAGLDKDGEAIPVWESVGFGFIEVGTVTAHAQQGPHPEAVVPCN